MTGILVPLFGEPRLLRAYSIIVVMVFFHWMMNDDMCILTMIESKITGAEKEQTFTSKIISPLYKIDNNQSKELIKTLFFLLWIFTQFRLGRLNIKEFTKS